MITLSTWNQEAGKRGMKCGSLDSSSLKWHQRNSNFNHFYHTIIAYSLGWCTADQNHKAGWWCTCLPSPMTSFWSWCPVDCSPWADFHHSVCPRCCRLGWLRLSSPAPRVLVWTERVWHEEPYAALLTTYRQQKNRSYRSVSKMGPNQEGSAV